MSSLKNTLPINELTIPEFPLHDDPAWNLALEEVLLYHAPSEYFMLWTNRPSVIIGRNQSAANEVNIHFAMKHDIPIFRRITGGGAVYHDEGNLNFTWIVNRQSEKDAEFFYHPIITALKAIGIHTSFNGRNDLITGNRKISGSAMLVQDGRVLFHGTLLIKSNLNMMEQILTPNSDKLYKNGVRSVRERVANASDIASALPAICELRSLIFSSLEEIAGVVVLKKIAESILGEVETLRRTKYLNENWNKHKNAFTGGTCENL